MLIRDEPISTNWILRYVFRLVATHWPTKSRIRTPWRFAPRPAGNGPWFVAPILQDLYFSDTQNNFPDKEM